jgi:hypothetical protein
MSPSIPIVFFGQPGSIQAKNNTLGKRKRDQSGQEIIFYEQGTDLPPKKRYRINPPENYNYNWFCSPPDTLVSPPTPPPWHQGDRFVRQIPEAELAALVEPPSPNPLPHPGHHLLYTDLSNPIHPLLQPLLGLSTTLPFLTTSLRLATKFLTSPHTLPFFHNLITAPLTLLQEESHIFNAPVTWLPESPFTNRAGLPPAEYQLTMQTLVALSDHIDIQISPDPRLASRWAYTERHTPPRHLDTNRVKVSRGKTIGKSLSVWLRASLTQLFPTPADLHPPQPQSQPQNQANHLLTALNFGGTNALINLSPLFLQTLHPHFTHSAPSSTSQPSSAITPSQRERAIFFLATTLVHELAHAVFMTRFPVLSAQNVWAAQHPGAAASESSSSSNGSSDGSGEEDSATTEYEPFQARDRAAELGHAAEAALFGGGKILVLGQTDHFGLGLAWVAWPGVDSEGFFVRDRSGGVRAFARAEEGGKVVGQHKWETVYPLDWRWIRGLFLEGFWDAVDASASAFAPLSFVDFCGDGKLYAFSVPRSHPQPTVSHPSTGPPVGISPLHPPKTLGSRLRNYDWPGLFSGAHTGAGVIEADDGYDFTSGSREGRGREWAHDESGVVRVGQGWVREVEEDEDEDGWE